MGDLELGVENIAHGATQLKPPISAHFDLDYLLWADARKAGKPLHGLVGFGQDANGVWGESVRWARRPDRPGASSARRPPGRGGPVVTGSGNGVFGRGATGVHGEGTNFGVVGESASIGLLGEGTSEGVIGMATAGAGVHAQGTSHGVFGFASAGAGVTGEGRVGVFGLTDRGSAGVLGIVKATQRQPGTGAAVRGVVETHRARPRNSPVTAIHGVAPEVAAGRPTEVKRARRTGRTEAEGVSRGAGGRVFQGLAGVFDGPVVVNGPFTVSGFYPKSAAVRHPDGRHRRLYCVEATESVFEDVGRARLREGSATVRLDPEFAALIRTNDYYVFVTAEGECGALYVAARSRNGFMVREASHGRSTTPFSYRIVARRRDVDAPRLERMTLPDTRAIRGDDAALLAASMQRRERRELPERPRAPKRPRVPGAAPRSEARRR